MAINKKSAKRIKTVVKGLQKAARSHAKQSRVLSGVLSENKKRSGKRNR